MLPGQFHSSPPPAEKEGKKKMTIPDTSDAPDGESPDDAKVCCYSHKTTVANSVMSSAYEVMQVLRCGASAFYLLASHDPVAPVRSSIHPDT